VNSILDVGVFRDSLFGMLKKRLLLMSENKARYAWELAYVDSCFGERLLGALCLQC